MNDVLTNYAAGNDGSTEILESAILTFEENLIANDSDDCPRYGCTCIAYEKGCGCLVQ